MPLSSDSVVAMTIDLQSTGHLIEDTARDTDVWIRAEIVIVTENGSHMEQLKVTIHATSPQTCTTIDVAVRGSVNGMSRTDGKAAGVSTNEGGVEPGPIAHPPRWVQPDLRLCFSSPHLPPPISVSSTPLFLSLCLSLTIYSLQLLELVSSTIFMICFCSVRRVLFYLFSRFCLNWHLFLAEHFHFYPNNLL